eukprot:769185-Rhodomonas_salina.1
MSTATISSSTRVPWYVCIPGYPGTQAGTRYATFWRSFANELGARSGGARNSYPGYPVLVCKPPPNSSEELGRKHP